MNNIITSKVLILNSSSIKRSHVSMEFDMKKITPMFMLENMMVTGCAYPWFERITDNLEIDKRIVCAFSLMVAELFIGASAITKSAKDVIESGYKSMPALNGNHGVKVTEYDEASYIDLMEVSFLAHPVEFDGRSIH